MKRRIISVIMCCTAAIATCSNAFAQEYVVKKGDTLYQIAKKYQTTYTELAKRNNIENPDLIFPGQLIQIEEILQTRPVETDPVETVKEAGTSPRKETEKTPAELVDPKFALSMMEKISSFGDNPDIGNRSAGSPAEQQVSDLVYQTFQEIGLENVTMEEFSCDNWTFEKGRVYYTDAEGKEQFLVLGGYATQFQADMEEYDLVYAGRGTVADYEGLDVKDKIVLIDIDQYQDWWINLPAYQAHLKGAAAVLACNTDGYAQYDADTIGSQDICGPYDAPAFAVSKNSAETLKQLLETNGGQITVKMDVDSQVKLDGTSQNVWGEIKGKTDEVVYYFAHCDGYYHSFFDDAQGIGEMCAIAKAFVDSGVQPEKTIRFVAHGAEEWGKTDTEWDWAVGAYKMITELHPEWAKNAVAILNLDGMYAVEGQKDFAVATSYELHEYAENAVAKLDLPEGYTIKVKSPTSNYTEDFSYQRAGVPAIVASGVDFEKEAYRSLAYHSSMDSKQLGVDETTMKMTMELFANMGLELSNRAVRPVEFNSILAALEESYTGTEQLNTRAAKEAAAALQQKCDTLQAEYDAAVKAGQQEEIDAKMKEAVTLNAKTHEIFRQMEEDFSRFDYTGEVQFPHVVYQNNIAALNGAIAALEGGSAAEALDEYLFDVDYNWYAYDFDEETFDYMADKIRTKSVGTWGEGMLEQPNEDLFAVIKSLQGKYGQENADFQEELDALQAAKANQEAFLRERVEKENADLAAIAEQMQEAAK
ncbi:MAG: M28 family peptidase [Clostridiales bacterium]|nr:M28 family peptidase [Clostridiales bacterium]